MANKSSAARAQIEGPCGGPTADPIDRAYFARFTLGNPALEREVLELFAEQAPVYLARLMAAGTTREWSDAAHTIKGSASAIGAWRLVAVAEAAEQIEPGALASGRKAALAAVAEAIDEACRYIEQLYAREQASPPQA